AIIQGAGIRSPHRRRPVWASCVAHPCAGILAEQTGDSTNGESTVNHDSWQARVQPVLESTMRDKAVPGIVLAVARGIRPPEFLAVGTDAAGVPLAADTLLPVASITKLATALTVLRLVASGAF